jgi:prepilin-type N-terminal cleavage/methylation domain-containing protein
MPLKASPSTLLRLREEHGLTLIEVLVATVISLVVTFAAFSILDISLSQSSRISDRVSADRRGRIAMERIVLKLHSSCVAPETTPVEAGSEGNKLLIVSQTGAQASFTQVELHEISFTEAGGKGKLTDTSYLNIGAAPAPNWEFSKTVNSTTTLLTGVGKSGATPIFQYFKYEGSELSKTAISETKLSEKTAGEVSAITVSFTATPESEHAERKSGERNVELANSVILRLSPASPSSSNLPCA